MKSTLACAAGWGQAASAASPDGNRGFGFTVSGRAKGGLALVLAAMACCHASAAEPTAPDTDTALWRATHSLLLGIARTGKGLVAVGTAGNVLLSADDGATWHAASHVPTDELLTNVVFPTPAEGWAVGQDEMVLHTTDGGETWAMQHVAAASDQTMFSIISLGGQHLLATGAYNLTLETYDGRTWKDGKIPNTDDDYHLNCAVARGGDVLVTGESGHAFIRYAGAWTPMKLPYDGSQFACLVGPEGSFWSFGLRGSVFKAEAGESTWTRLATDETNSIFGAADLSDGRMALVGANGLVTLLDPATGKFTQLHPVTGATLSAVVQGQGGKLIVVGEDGVHVIDPNAQQAGLTQ